MGASAGVAGPACGVFRNATDALVVLMRRRDRGLRLRLR